MDMIIVNSIAATLLAITIVTVTMEAITMVEEEEAVVTVDLPIGGIKT